MIDKGQWREFGQDTGVTPLLFTRSAMGFLMATESQDLGLTLRGRLYRRRYQLVFFKTSAKDIKNTQSILVVQISVIHQLKLWSVYFFCVHSRIQQNFVVLGKKKKTNRMRSLSSPSPRAALQNMSLKWTVTQRKLNTRTWELYL